MIVKKYTIKDAVEIVQQLEPVFAEIGLHLAIGGSCVYSDGSDKDIDLFIYPHSRDVILDRVQILSILADKGFDRVHPLLVENSHTKVPDVFVSIHYKTLVRVDWFFLERHNLHLEDSKDDRPKM